MQQYKRLIPLMNRVLVKKFEPTTKTAGGIILQNATEKNPVGVIIEVKHSKTIRLELDIMTLGEHLYQLL